MWHLAMETPSALLVPCEENHRWIHLTKSFDVSFDTETTQQTVEGQVPWDVLTLIWRHCNWNECFKTIP